MSRRLFSASIVCASLFVAVTPALAERVAVASFRMSGELPDSARAALRASLAGGLSAAGYDVLSDEALARAIKEAPGLAGCETTACLRRLATVASVERVMRGTLEILGSNYHFSLELLASDGSTVARIDDDCQVCNAKEANDSLSTAASNLRGKPNVVVPPPLPPATPHAKPSLFRTLGIASAAVGAAAFVVGVVLVAVDGSTYGSVHETSSMMLEQRHIHTLGGGISLILIGAGLGGVAGVLFWKDSKRPKVSVSGWADPTSVGLSAAGAF